MILHDITSLQLLKSITLQSLAIPTLRNLSLQYNNNNNNNNNNNSYWLPGLSQRCTWAPAITCRRFLSFSSMLHCSRYITDLRYNPGSLGPGNFQVVVLVYNNFITTVPHLHLCLILNRPQNHCTHNSAAGKRLPNQNTAILHLQIQLNLKINLNINLKLLGFRIYPFTCQRMNKSERRSWIFKIQCDWLDPENWNKKLNNNCYHLLVRQLLLFLISNLSQSICCLVFDYGFGPRIEPITLDLTRTATPLEKSLGIPR